MNAIQLNFVNQSALRGKDIVFFQRNNAASASASAIAWKVIEQPGPQDRHTFEFSPALTVSVSDFYGDTTPQEAGEGDLFEVKRNGKSNELLLAKQPSSERGITIRNGLKSSTINAGCYRDGQLLATATGIFPGKQASFEFTPVLYMGAISGVEQGERMGSAMVAQLQSQISLTGIRSADIILTGGGSGTHATPLVFALTNIAYA